MMIMMGAQQKAWEQLRSSIASFQSAVMGLRNSRVRWSQLLFGLTLGGGCEISLGADAIQAHPELYMGLVEVGVGLIPGGGGCFGLLHNLQHSGPDIDPTVYLREAFMTIGMAKVAKAAPKRLVSWVSQGRRPFDHGSRRVDRRGEVTCPGHGEE